jgi:HEAT repeat protein
MRGGALVGVLTLAAGLLPAAEPGPKTDPVAELVKQLKSDGVLVRLKAARELGNLGTAGKAAVPALAEALHDVDKDVREQAGKALAQIGEAAVPALVKSLKDKTATTRFRAADGLATIGPEAKRAVPELTEALKDKDGYVRRAAARALGEIGPDAADAVTELIACLDDQAPPVRAQAADSLAAIGPAAVEKLGKALRNEKTEVCIGSAVALAKMGPAAGEAVEALGQALNDKEKAVRAASALALGELGPKAAPAVPGLLGLLEDESTRSHAVQALVNIGTSAVPELCKALNGGKAERRAAALATLAHFKPEEGREAVNDLIAVLKDKDAGFRGLAAFTLGQVGPKAKAAVPALTNAMDDADVQVQLAAIVALAKIQPDDAVAQKRVRDLMAPKVTSPPPAPAGKGVDARTLALQKYALELRRRALFNHKLDPREERIAAAQMQEYQERQAAFNKKMDQSFDPAREARYDKIIDLYVLANGEDMLNPNAVALLQAMDNLPPDSIFAVIRGLARYQGLLNQGVFATPS